MLLLCRDVLAGGRLAIPQLPHLKFRAFGLLTRSINDSSNGAPLSTLDSYFEKLSSQNQENANAGPQPQHQSPQIAGNTIPLNNYPEEEPPFDEYALKEQLLFSVLSEVESAEKPSLIARPPSQGAPPNANPSNSKHKLPIIVIDERKPGTSDSESEAPQPVPVIIVQPGSLLVPSLVGANVGVYVFGLATSQGSTGVDLALAHGAKVNDLILSGEWWRLITPLFLHSGFLHICLSSWALLSFGPQVEALYGSTGFLMLFFLGGGIGNLASFLESPSTATVGGTGPVFAVVCSWFAFMLKNRTVVKAYVTPELVQKSLVFASFSLLLGNEFPIDAWTHVGGALVGLLFGTLASPWYQPVDAEATTKPKGTAATEDLWDAENHDHGEDDVNGESMYLVLLLCFGAVACLYYIAMQEDTPDMNIFNNLME